VHTFCLMLYRFIYMGFDIAMEQHSWSHVGFIFFSIVSFLAHKLEVSWYVIYITLAFYFLLSASSLTHIITTSDIYRNCKVLNLYWLISFYVFDYCGTCSFLAFWIVSLQYKYLHAILSIFILCSLRSCKLYPWVATCRAANVFSCAYLVNLVRPSHRKIPPKHQKALWYSGKRLNNS